ncbi:MAG: hypothetical protein V1911_01685 [Candidatus Micrarchaeota archaeon]
MFGRKKKEISMLACPKCFEPYKPDKQVSNLFGISAYGFKCKKCGYDGAGPIKLVKEE